MPFELAEKPGGLNKLATFDLNFLDGIVNDIPLLIVSASMHTVYLNTKALEKIFPDNPDMT